MVKLVKLIALTLVATLLLGVGVACNKQHSHDFINGICTCGEKGDTYMTEGLTFMLDGENYVVSGYTGEEKIVYVPSKYNNLAVTEIGENAFTDANIEKVIIRNGVTTISNYAFKNCSALKEVELPDGIISVGFTAFIDCKELTYNSEGPLNYLGNANNPYVLLVSCDKEATAVTVNDDCKVIGVGAFENCFALQKVVLAKRINHVGGYVFSGTSLKILDYYGTEEDWKKITLDENWLTGSSILGISAYGGLIKLAD